MLTFLSRLSSLLRVDQAALTIACFAFSFLSLTAVNALRSVNPMPIPAMTVAWLLAIGSFLWGIWQFDRMNTGEIQPLRLDWTTLDLAIVALSLCIAIPLRTVYLDTAPLTIHNDEAAYVGHARLLAGQPLADFAYLDTSPHTNLWYYVQLLGLRLFGDTLAGARALAAFFGVVTLPALYLLARLLFTRRVAAIATLLLATFHFHIHFSRVALNNITDPFFGVLIFSCLVIGLRTQRLFFCALAGVIAGFSFYFYNGARLFAPLVAVMMLAWMVGQMPAWRSALQARVWAPSVAVMLGALTAAAPYLQNALADPHTFTQRYQRDGVSLQWLTETAAQRDTTPIWVALDQLLRGVFGPFLYHDVDVALFYDANRPLLWGVAALCTLMGMGIALWRWREWRYQLLVAWYLLAMIFGGVLMRNPPSVQRFVTLAPVFCLLMAISIDTMTTVLTTRWPRRQTMVRIAAVLLVTFIAADSIAAYFWGYLPRERYGTVNSQRMTVLAHALTPDLPNVTVYFIGPEAKNMQNSSIPRFLHGEIDIRTWHLTPREWSISLTHPPPPPPLDPTRATLFVAPLEDLARLQHLQSILPGGTLTPILWPKTGAKLLYVYRIAPVTLQDDRF